MLTFFFIFPARFSHLPIASFILRKAHSSTMPHYGASFPRHFTTISCHPVKWSLLPKAKRTRSTFSRGHGPRSAPAIPSRLLKSTLRRHKTSSLYDDQMSTEFCKHRTPSHLPVLLRTMGNLMRLRRGVLNCHSPVHRSSFIVHRPLFHPHRFPLRASD